MRAGRLRHRLRLQQPTETRGADGSFSRGWSTVATVWGGVEVLRGKEFFEAHQMNSETVYRIVLRYGDAWAGIADDWRVYDETYSKAYDITAVLSDDARARPRAMLELMAVRGKTDGRARQDGRRMTVRTQAELQTQIDTLLADNTAGGITDADLRSVLTDVRDTALARWVTTSPQVDPNSPTMLSLIDSLLDTGTSPITSAFISPADVRDVLEAARALIYYDQVVSNFDANTISGLVAWVSVDGSDLLDSGGSPISEVAGTTVSRWGNNLVDDATLGALYFNATGTPDYQTYNGFPCVRFNSGEYHTLSDGGTDYSTFSGSSITMFAAASFTAPSTNTFRYIASNAETNFSSTGVYMLVMDQRTNRLAAIADESTLVVCQMDAQDATDNIRVLAMRGQGALGDFDAWKDGSKTSDSPQTLENSNYNQDLAYIGRGLVATGASCYVHEVLMFDAALSDADVDAVNNYLIAKYGV